MTGDNRMRWVEQLDELEQVVKNLADAMRRHPRQDQWIVGDPSQALRETTPGHYLRDLPRLNTADDPDLHRTSSVLAQAIRAVTAARRQRWTAAELVPALDAIHTRIAPMRVALAASMATPVTLESIVAELRKEFTLSLAVMLSGQYAVVTKLYEWYSSSSGVPKAAYLNVRQFTIVDEAGPGCIPMRDLEIATHGGITMLTPQTGFVSIDRFSPVQQLLYGQWFAFMHSLWDEQYRRQVALAHGTAPDGKAWKAADIRVPLSGTSAEFATTSSITREWLTRPARQRCSIGLPKARSRRSNPSK
ncbi:hypothetical protein FK535_18180 [Mycolicibacterium sp. 018/SC-01/001]|uniref:hypothetical protein n=1 Tax=Mycolicibacterium sp. 018/SC-01/001 TaxID=2592069 RepID=UPI0011802B8E|nr:hypothetical protein [Mycolicibacterium sp. 018/SC-01/001]TRW80988.1 hypothetical protein FK535_18180 [Mycolicibacterium sp. 018/SC-01/001]